MAEGETGHAFGHFDFLSEVGDPVTGVPVGATTDNLKSAIEGETYEYTEMYPGFARTARDEGFDEVGGVARDAGQGREEPRRPLHPGPRDPRRLKQQFGSWRRPRGESPGSCAVRARLRTSERSDAVRKLTVDDIVDHRAYERERDEFRAARHRDEEAAAGSRSATS